MKIFCDIYVSKWVIQRQKWLHPLKYPNSESKIETETKYEEKKRVLECKYNCDIFNSKSLSYYPTTINYSY